MLARIIGGVLAVRCADRCARLADGCDAGALLGAVREVGGDGNRRGWHDMVAVLGCPALPRGLPRAVGAGGVGSAGRFERSGDARLVGGADGRRGAGGGGGGGYRNGPVGEQQLNRLLDELLHAGIFLRRDDAELPRRVRRDVSADVAAALPACGRRSAPRRAALECGRVVVGGGAHAAPLMVCECSRRSSVRTMNACTAATS